MSVRYASIWFRHLITDQKVSQHPVLQDAPFVLAAPERGRMVVKATNAAAQKDGIENNMVLADARALYPALEVFDYTPGQEETLLRELAEWCIRFTPIVGIDPPDGLILDITGCAHLWGGEEEYLKTILEKLKSRHFQVNGAIADTIAVAWGCARYCGAFTIVGPRRQREALMQLPPAALRLDSSILDRLHRLGLYLNKLYIDMPRPTLRRRFGQALLSRLDQALGYAIEFIEPVVPPVPFQERLPCLEPIVTARGIEIALRNLLITMGKRLVNENKGIRKAIFKGFRVDGKVVQIDIVTTRASYNVEHLFKLFELKIVKIAPGLGIELFVLEASAVDDMVAAQISLWNRAATMDNLSLMELLDRLAGRLGIQVIHRFLPDEHYWPERSVRVATVQEKQEKDWRDGQPRPVNLLGKPEKVLVSAPRPDYLPVLFNHKNVVYYLKSADGPERIESEWWLEAGELRDYYYVEDRKGSRYWLFKLGHDLEAQKEMPDWFIHGFFS